MKTTRKLQVRVFLLRAFIVPLAVAVLTAILPLAAGAQVTTAPKVVYKQPKIKLDTFHGEVVNFTSKAITVRDPKNVYNVRTFDYSPQLEQKLQNRLMEKGAKVTVKYQTRSNVAVVVKGKIIKQAQ
jgi:hypothetical protein